MKSRVWPVVAVFVVAVAVISQALEMVRAGLAINGDVFALAQYGPALAALVTWLIFRKRLVEIMPAPVRGRQVRINLLVALAACLVFAMVLWLGYAVIGGQAAYGLRHVGGMSFSVLAGLWLLGAAAEEIGWRGLLQPALEFRLPRWAAAVVTGLLWSVWHLPVVTQGPAIAATFIASTTTFAVLLAYLGSGSPRQRVAVTSVVHWLVNLAILAIAGTDVSLTELIGELIAMGIAITVVLLLVARFRAGRVTSTDHAARTERVA